MACLFATSGCFADYECCLFGRHMYHMFWQRLIARNNALVCWRTEMSVSLEPKPASEAEYSVIVRTKTINQDIRTDNVLIIQLIIQLIIELIIELTIEFIIEF